MIITDEEFNEAVPDLDAPLDPDLAEPLESIEEFERRMAAEMLQTEAALDPSGDPSGAFPDGAPGDVELARPLAPIEQFDTTPPEFAEIEQVDDVELTYRTEINGLEEADRQSGVDLRDMFDDLSALREGNGRAANIAMISARLREDVDLINAILASQGWFSPQISTQVDRVDPDDRQNIIVRIDIGPGKRYSLAQINIETAPTVPPGLVKENLDLHTGRPVIAEEVLAAEANVAVALPRHGYPFAQVGEHDIALDADTGEAFYTLPVETGPRGRYGDIATTGELAFDAQHIGVIARFERGDLYDGREVDDLRRALRATGLFSAVSVEPRRTGESAGDDTEYVTIVVDQQAGPARTIAGSAGYGTGEGLRVEGSWTHRNMFPPEGALSVRGVAGTSEQGLGVTFRRSNAGKRDRTLELVAEARHSDFDAYSAYTGRLAGRISRDSTPIWQKRFTYSFGLELLASAERDFDFDLGERRRRTYYIAGLAGQVGFDTTESLLDPTRGFRFTALIQPEGSLAGGFHPYVRARVEGSAYMPLGRDLVVAGRIRLGSIQGSARADIPPSRRFYAGGGGSVRGFGYQSLGPLDPNGDPIGGRSLNEGSAEVRYRFGDHGVVGFVDVGQSYASSMPRFSDLRFGVGLGYRYYTNFGPVRVDVATPIARRPGESRLNIYVSIGQAF
jgi:translocation and assembly module TamA